MFIIYMHTVYVKSIPAISTMNLQLSLPYLLEATNSISPMSALFTFSSFSVCWSSSGIVISYRPGLLARTTPLLGTKAFSVRSDTYRKEGSRVSLSQDIIIESWIITGNKAAASLHTVILYLCFPVTVHVSCYVLSQKGDKRH